MKIEGIVGLLLRVVDTEFAKQLVYCFLYWKVGHCFPLFIVLSFHVDCFVNSHNGNSSNRKQCFVFL